LRKKLAFVEIYERYDIIKKAGTVFTQEGDSSPKAPISGIHSFLISMADGKIESKC
jgi:hypothetical protein